jgi:hypothetical protein
MSSDSEASAFSLDDESDGFVPEVKVSHLMSQRTAGSMGRQLPNSQLAFSSPHIPFVFLLSQQALNFLNTTFPY